VYEAVSLSSILSWLGLALVAMASIFLVTGTLRTRSARHSSGTEVPSEEMQRLKAIRRVDWRSAALLVCVALVAFALSLSESGPFFTGPSGNVAGGVMLIALIVGLIVGIVLGIRHMDLSRTLRALDNRSGTDQRSAWRLKTPR